MGTARLWLVRHGETDWNAIGRIQGQTPTDLNDKGRRQASALAAILKNTQRPFAACYSSDLPRAAQTAQIVASALGLTVQTSAALRERSFGTLEGTTSEQIRARRAELGLHPSGDLADWTGVPGVESNDALWERTRIKLEEIAARHSGDDVLVVTHGGVISRAVYRILGIPDTVPRRFPLSNGMVVVIERTADAFHLLALGDLGFLAGHDRGADTSRVTSAD